MPDRVTWSTSSCSINRPPFTTHFDIIHVGNTTLCQRLSASFMIMVINKQTSVEMKPCCPTQKYCSGKGTGEPKTFKVGVKVSKMCKYFESTDVRGSEETKSVCSYDVWCTQTLTALTSLLLQPVKCQG